MGEEQALGSVYSYIQERIAVRKRFNILTDFEFRQDMTFYIKFDGEWFPFFEFLRETGSLETFRRAMFNKESGKWQTPSAE